MSLNRTLAVALAVASTVPVSARSSRRPRG